jgi:hypothetical protein
VSIVILNFNGEGCLEQCLSSVFKTDYPNYEVILVDNASTDEGLDRTKKTFGSNSNLKIVRNSENLGFSQGNNIGFKHSKGKYVVFLNNDTVVEPSMLKILVKTMMTDRTIGLAQSLLLRIDGRKIQTAGWLFSDYLILQSSLAENESPQCIFPPMFEVSFVSGAAMIIERELIHEIGLFEPTVGFYYDDTLLSLKTWIAGKRVVTVSQSRVRHIGGATIGRNIGFTTYHVSKARICLIFDTYHGLWPLTKALFVFTVSLLSNSILFRGPKDLSLLFGDIRAMTWGVRNMKLVWKNRLRHWSKARIPPDLLVSKLARIRIPIALYLIPSNLASRYLKTEVLRYRNSLEKLARTRMNLTHEGNT